VRSSVTISLVSEARGGPFVFWEDLRQGAQQAAELGFDAIEIFPPNPDALVQSQAADVAAELGLAVAAVGTGAGWLIHRWSLADPTPSVRQSAIDFIRRMLDEARALHAPVIIGSMQGRSTADVPRDHARGYLRDALQILDRHAANIQSRLLYEPLNRYETDQCNTLADGCDLIADLPHTQLLADWFHMNIEEADMAEALRRAGPAIGHIHFADTNRRAVGMGHLDPKPLLDALRSIGYTGYLSAEVFPLPDSQAAAKATIEAFRTWAAT
jgi:sugar phosphate isomerase/epimerase